MLIMNGFHYFLRGLDMLFRSGLRRYVVVPLLINTLLFGGFLWFGVHEFSALLHWLTDGLPTWLKWLSGLLWLFFAFAAVVIVTYAFALVANLIAAPFNGLLSEKVEQSLTGSVAESHTGLLSALSEGPRAIKRQVQYLFYYVPRALMMLVLFLVPLVHLIASPCWFLFNGWMMSVQYMDYPMDNHRVPFDEMRVKLKAKRATHLSFGSIVMFATMIPVLNFFVMPAAVIGATLLWVEEHRDEVA